jgi:glutamyl-tRNA reductase
MDQVRLFGLNHTTATLDVRDRLALDAQRHREVVQAVRSALGCETVALSTCNRVEFYLAHADTPPALADVTRLLSGYHGIPAESFSSHLYAKSGRQAVEHLFNVAASLDSMVLGETQILGQVKQAYDLCKALGATGPVLNPLFQRALSVGKQVQTHTGLSEGRLSVASVAVDYARGIFDRFGDKTILCIGAGEITSLVIQHLAQLNPGHLVVCNRDLARAKELADRFGGEASPLDKLDDQLVRADIVVSCTAAAEPIIRREQFEKLLRRRRYRPAFLIDLAVPRDVEPKVGELENVYLYNLDDLQRVVAQTRGQRGEAVDAARQIVARNVDEFDAWLKRRALGPAIEQLYARYHSMAGEELSRVMGKMPHLTVAERAHLQEMTRRIVNKVLHDPMEAIARGDSTHAPAGQYLHAIEKLFKLLPEQNERGSEDNTSAGEKR